MAKVMYGAAFVVVLPVLLVLWARGSEGVVRLAAYGDARLGWGLAWAGMVMMAGAMWQLWRQGGGLPMNAFPPERLVTVGLYRWVGHPIYTGFVLTVWGVSMAFGSRSGLWMVTPLAALGCAALVLGYEGLDLEERFGAERVVRVLDSRVRTMWVAGLPVAVLLWLGGGPWWVWAMVLMPREFAVRSWAAMAVGVPLLWPSAWWVLLALLPWERLWAVARRGSEWVANSWADWRFGPVRVINHGLWVGLGTGIGMAIVMAAGGRAWVVLATTVSGVAGAGLWAQWVEGSPRLQRPFGFYGGLIGVFLACAVFEERWLLWGAYSLAGPWVQALGRIRCLVQGCCHGVRAREGVGIVYRREESRVNRMAHLRGVPVHATQTYSILWNVVTGLVLGRLWREGAAVGLVAGLWLILNGAGRFVEEAYRGEVQTAVRGGLRLYQWLAMGSAAAGAVVTCWGGGAAPALEWGRVNWWVTVVGFGLVAFAMGVDFPGSGRRFARLTQG